MECFFLFLLTIGIPVIIGIVNANKESQTKKQALNGFIEIQKKLNADLTVKYSESTIEAKDGEKIPCHKVTISGTCKVPHVNYPCRIHFNLLDVTEQGTDKYPVLCTIPEWADEYGFFKYDTEIKMPYEVTSFEDTPVLAFPAKAMILPKRGNRRLEAYVAITPAGSDRCLKIGKTYRNAFQKEHGYLEFEQRSIETNQAIARMAIAICASDGCIDKRETAVVTNYFSEQFAHIREPEKIKAEVNRVLKNLLAEHKDKRLNVKIEIEKSCKQLVDAGTKSDIHSAYELAVRVVAADEIVQKEEKIALRRLAELLEIPANLAKEMQDKYFRVSMFGQGAEEAFLDIPKNLSKEEKIQFLNKEYQKWRGRVTHQDEKVRTEAEMRIQAITRARKKLESEPVNA